MASRLTRLFRPENVRAAFTPLLNAAPLAETTRSPVVKTTVSLDAISDRKPIHNKFRHQEFGILDELKKVSGTTSVPIFFVGGFYALCIQDSRFLVHTLTEFVSECAAIPLIVYAAVRAGQSMYKKMNDEEAVEEINIMYALDEEKNVAARKVIADAATMGAFLDDRPEFFDIMNNQKQLESEIIYRKRLQEVEVELKKRLDYQVEIQNVSRAIEEKHIATWVENEVLKSIAEEGDGDTFRACLSALESMAAEKATA